MAQRVFSDLHGELAKHDLTCTATVREGSRAADHVVILSPERAAVVRSVACGNASDCAAIATMISQGDFIWGAIVYSESVEPDPVGLIPSFHVGQLGQLISYLQELREASDGSD